MPRPADDTMPRPVTTTAPFTLSAAAFARPNFFHSATVSTSWISGSALFSSCAKWCSITSDRPWTAAPSADGSHRGPGRSRL